MDVTHSFPIFVLLLTGRKGKTWKRFSRDMCHNVMQTSQISWYHRNCRISTLISWYHNQGLFAHSVLCLTMTYLVTQQESVL